METEKTKTTDDDFMDAEKASKQTDVDVQERIEPTSRESDSSTSSNLSVVTVFLMAQVACMLYLCLQASVKELQLNYGVSVCEINFLRTCCTLIGSVILCVLIGKNPFTGVERGLTPILLVRSLSGAAAFITVTKAVSMVPLTIFQVITNMAPFFSGLLACIWLGEKLAPFQIFAMLCCFGGIAIIITAPTSPQDADTLIEEQSFDRQHLGIILALTCVFLFAISGVTTRRIRSLHYSVIQFHVALVSVVVSTVWLLTYKFSADGQDSDKVSLFTFEGGYKPWLIVIGGSMCHFFAQVMTTCMNQSINPATVGMFMYMQIVYAYLVDLFVFDEMLTWLQLLGAGITMAFAVASAIHKRRLAAQEEQEQAKKKKIETNDGSEDGYKRI